MPPKASSWWGEPCQMPMSQQPGPRLTTRSRPTKAPGRLPYYLANSFCPDLFADGTIFALLRNSGLIDLLEELFGQRATARCNDTAQIALHLPDYQTEPVHWRPPIDGFPAGLNTVPQGTVSRQTALIGVYLSEARPNMGNLTVWPGSPRRIAQFMRDTSAKLPASEWCRRVACCRDGNGARQARATHRRPRRRGARASPLDAQFGSESVASDSLCGLFPRATSRR